MHWIIEPGLRKLHSLVDDSHCTSGFFSYLTEIRFKWGTVYGNDARDLIWVFECCRHVVLVYRYSFDCSLEMKLPIDLLSMIRDAL